MKVNRCISIGVDEAEYLNSHDEINLSKLVRQLIEKLMMGEEN